MLEGWRLEYGRGRSNGIVTYDCVLTRSACSMGFMLLGLLGAAGSIEEEPEETNPHPDPASASFAHVPARQSVARVWAAATEEQMNQNPKEPRNQTLATSQCGFKPQLVSPLRACHWNGRYCSTSMVVADCMHSGKASSVAKCDSDAGRA